jgi:hypothetical protein
MAASARLRSVTSRITDITLPSGISVAMTSAEKSEPSLRLNCHSRWYGARDATVLSAGSMYAASAGATIAEAWTPTSSSRL